MMLYVYTPIGKKVISTLRSTPLPIPAALPGAAFGQDGTLWLVSEKQNAKGGREVVLARSGDQGLHWTALPPIPTTTTGTATFTSVAAGASGHVGVLYYYTTANGDPGTLDGATWSITIAAE